MVRRWLSAVGASHLLRWRTVKDLRAIESKRFITALLRRVNVVLDNVTIEDGDGTASADGAEKVVV